jgi:putative endonuclease
MAISSQRIVYILKNAETPPRYYTGVTSDLAARLIVHNKGGCPHTAKYRPWNVDVNVKFGDEYRAVAFEKYLKSGSGHEASSCMPNGMTFLLSKMPPHS